ncbi:MAG TPA: helix-turn-helix domain-containing protein [Hyphomicrobium sp.]|nr:helix-turn-helix domain-containing protein [Hyphomicrobium sp.]
MDIPDNRRLVTPAELAALIGLSEKTLENRRANGTGPKSFKIGRRVFYRVADVRAWLQAQGGDL